MRPFREWIASGVVAARGNKRSAQGQSISVRSSFQVETLEPRLLLNADPLTIAVVQDVVGDGTEPLAAEVQPDDPIVRVQTTAGFNFSTLEDDLASAVRLRARRMMKITEKPSIQPKASRSILSVAASPMM